MVKKLLLTAGCISVVVLGFSSAQADGWVPIVPPGQVPYQTKAPLTGSIANTRHNLTQSFNPAASVVMSVAARNNYGEVCVYCHTPHGANTNIAAPIWNRTINTGQYVIYDKLRTLNRPIGQPGPNSLTCLSCHDGTIAIDSIINMPGSGGFKAEQMTTPTVDKAWLDTWRNRDVSGAPLPSPSEHATMGVEFGANSVGTVPDQGSGKCSSCHQVPDVGMPDFRVFVIGTDLRNDHPIGILFPDAFGSGIDFNQPNGAIAGKMTFFDSNGNNYADKGEPRMYDTGEGPEVECASCHDPHGVPIAGAQSQFIPSFLRVSNGNVNTGEGSSSGLCLTCHEK